MRDRSIDGRFCCIYLFALVVERGSAARVLLVFSDSSRDETCAEQWLLLLAQELQRGCSIEGSVVDVHDLSDSLLWEFDMLVVAIEALQEVDTQLLSCLSGFSFHRATVILSLSGLCYQCLTGVRPIGVQDTVIADRSLRSSAYDVLLSRESADADHAPEAIGILLCLLDRDKKSTLQEPALARKSVATSVKSFTEVQKRRALALKSILCHSHDYKIVSNVFSTIALETVPANQRISIMGSRIMLFSLMAEIMNYCNGTGSMSEDVVSIQRLS